MTIKLIPTLFAVFSLLVIPAVSLASTYQYISNNGSLLSVQANSASEALATASNIDPHSGVMLVGAEGKITQSDNTNPTPVSGFFYQYINTSGQLQSIEAVSATAAIANASNIDPHSGVILVTDNTKLTN